MCSRGLKGGISLLNIEPLTQYIYGCLFITVYSKQTIETQLLSQSRSKKFIQFSDIYIATSSHALVKY